MVTLDFWRRLPHSKKTAIVGACYRGCGLDPEDSVLIIENMKVLDRFAEQAHAVRKTGRDHYSARTIIEVLRHNSMIEDNDPNYKINNNITPLMARISMNIFPELNGFFQLRTLTSKVN